MYWPTPATLSSQMHYTDFDSDNCMPSNLSICLSAHQPVCLLWVSVSLNTCLSVWQLVCMYVRAISLWIWQMEIFLPFTNCVTYIHMLPSHSVIIGLLIFIHVFKETKNKKRNQNDGHEECNKSQYFSLSQISHPSFCLVAFYLSLCSDNNRLFHVDIFSSDPSGSLPLSVSFTQTN